MKRFLFAILKSLGTLAMWFVTLAMLICIVRLPLVFADTNPAWAFLAGFLIGLPIFYKYRCVPFYVFGHELTHWSVATLFLRKTSNIRMGSHSGSVDVENPNIWITLAPYFLPFYMLLILGIYGAVLLFRPQFPAWVDIAIAVILGLAYAYHIILTCIAISKGQQDLELNGFIFSLSFIVICNVFYIYLGLMVATQQLRSGFHLLFSQIVAQSAILWKMICELYALCRSSDPDSSV